MELLKRILASTKTTIVLSILFVIFFAIDFEIIASYLYGNDNPTNKGQLFGTTLTAIGGICVIWGLYLNNKKVNQQIRQVNEQVRQNDIAIQNSNDKRFGEAIGYLNDDNEGIAIGGAYALYQLAKEDSRYAPIITNIFYNYVIDNNADEESTKTFQIVLSLLFSENNPFISDKELVFTNFKFINRRMYCTRYNVKFERCVFYSVSLIGDDGSIHFVSCSVNKSFAANFKYITINKGSYTKMTMGNGSDSEIEITASVLSKSQIISTNITSLFFDVKNIEDVEVYTNTANKVYINNLTKEQISSSLFFYYASEIKEIYIDDELVIDRDGLNLTRNDVMRRDRICRWIAGFQNQKPQIIFLYLYNS